MNNWIYFVIVYLIGSLCSFKAFYNHLELYNYKTVSIDDKVMLIGLSLLSWVSFIFMNYVFLLEWIGKKFINYKQNKNGGI